MSKQVNNQTSKDKNWIDETGTSIPFNRTHAIERLKEKKAFQLYKKALVLNNELVKFKEHMAEVCDEVYKKAMEELKNESPNKGNFTWYNFDRSIRIEVKINERIEFEDMAIQACKDKLNKYISENTSSTDPLIPQLINDAFSTQRGKLDAKKVMGLLRYRSRIKNELFQQAMDHLEESIRRPSSKAYYMISVRTDEGKYELLDLNFASVR